MILINERQVECELGLSLHEAVELGQDDLETVPEDEELENPPGAEDEADGLDPDAPRGFGPQAGRRRDDEDDEEIDEELDSDEFDDDEEDDGDDLDEDFDNEDEFDDGDDGMDDLDEDDEVE